MKFYNFSRKFWQETALSWTFLGGQKFHRGGRGPVAPWPSLEPPLITRPHCDSRATCFCGPTWLGDDLVWDNMSVCLSVRLSVTCRSRVKTTDWRIMLISLPCHARFRPPSATVVSAEPFSHGTGTLRCLQKEMATYRHWSVARPRDPDDVSHCRILSPDKTEWRLISSTLCGWGRCFVADTHTRRRRLPCHPATSRSSTDERGKMQQFPFALCQTFHLKYSSNLIYVIASKTTSYIQFLWAKHDRSIDGCAIMVIHFFIQRLCC